MHSKSLFRFLLLPDLINALVILTKLQTNPVNTMPLIRRRIVSLSLKHMPQMAPTVTAHDLRPLHAKGAVRMPRHGTRDAVKVRGPPATALELMVGLIERRLAGGARVDARVRVMLVEFVGEGRLGALFAEDAELFW
jgi:hypothetical protein